MDETQGTLLRLPTAPPRGKGLLPVHGVSLTVAGWGHRIYPLCLGSAWSPGRGRQLSASCSPLEEADPPGGPPWTWPVPPAPRGPVCLWPQPSPPNVGHLSFVLQTGTLKLRVTVRKRRARTGAGHRSCPSGGEGRRKKCPPGPVDPPEPASGPAFHGPSGLCVFAASSGCLRRPPPRRSRGGGRHNGPPMAVALVPAAWAPL